MKRVLADVAERIEEDDGWICEPLDGGVCKRIENPVLRDLYAYWDEIRSGRSFPARNDVDPVAIPKLVSYLGLFEILDSGRAFNVRLLGSQIQNHVRTDVTGRTLDGLSPGIVTRRIHRTLGLLVRHRCAYHLTTPSSSLPGKDFYSAEGLMLPLSAGGDSVRFALGSQILTPREGTR